MTTVSSDEVAGEDGDPDGSTEPSGLPEGGERSSRAGRDLPAAIAVGVTLGAAILVALFTVRFVFIGIVAAAIALGTVEFARAVRAAAGIRMALVPVLLGGQAMIWLSWPYGLRGVLVAFVLTAFACLLWRLPGGAENYLRDVGISVFLAVYLPLFASFAAMLVPAEDGTGRVLAFMIGVVASDTGGYAAGILGGKHPMAPSISPKKTWEGFSGSMVTGVVAGALALHFLLGAQYWHGVVFGAVIVIVASIGDLFESLVKRDLGIKDMGNLLPGHGGMMDRLDSLLPAAVASWLLLTVLVPIS